MVSQQLNILRLMSILSFTHFLAIEAEYTSYGTPHFSHNFPWVNHNKYPNPTYSTDPTKSQWYPVAGPYTYGPAVKDHYTTPFPHHHFHDYPPGFSQQQVVHIHDVGLADEPNGDGYQEGNDYNIHNFISHVDTLHQDLVHEASSNVETRKQTPNTTTANRRSSLNKRRAQNKPVMRKRNDNKRKQSQASSLIRRRPIEGQFKTRSKTTFRKPTRSKQPTRLSQRQDPQFRRKEALRRNTRPTRKTHSRRPYYNDYQYYGRRRENQGHRENGYRNSNKGAGRQDYYYDYDYADDYGDYYYYDYDNYDETTTDEPDEPTSTEETTLATVIATTATTTTTTEAPETTTIVSTTEVNTMVTPEVPHSDGHDGHDGYGPSNGNENISITYAPIVHDNPIPNLWYPQQAMPDIFQYRNYFSSRDILN